MFLPSSTQTSTSTTTWVEISFNLKISNHPPHLTEKVRFNSKRVIGLHLQIKHLNPNLNINLNPNPNLNPNSNLIPNLNLNLTNVSLSQLPPQFVIFWWEKSSQTKVFKIRSNNTAKFTSVPAYLDWCSSIITLSTLSSHPIHWFGVYKAY